MPTDRRFQLVLIKPSHYDDDGYVIRWWRAMIPSNSLAAVYGIAVDCAERQVLGTDVGIYIDPMDETHTRVNIPALLARFRQCGNFGLVALVGVQSNQYPRALDIARPLRAAGISIAIGGFHVSGCMSMLDVGTGSHSPGAADPSRHALPQDPKFHRKGQACGSDPRLHRA